MRDFRDAKAMAQTLRESLTTSAVTITHSESLELVSRMLGVADWNTLSALLQADRRPAASCSAVSPVGRERTEAGRYPAVSIRDFVPFPTAVFPLYIGREKTKAALDQAFRSGRDVVLAIQKDAGVEEPGPQDVLEIGLLAQLVEHEQMEDGTLRVVVEAYRYRYPHSRLVRPLRTAAARTAKERAIHGVVLPLRVLKFSITA